MVSIKNMVFYGPSLKKCNKCGYEEECSVHWNTSMVIGDSILCSKCFKEFMFENIGVMVDEKREY